MSNNSHLRNGHNVVVKLGADDFLSSGQPGFEEPATGVYIGSIDGTNDADVHHVETEDGVFEYFTDEIEPIKYGKVSPQGRMLVDYLGKRGSVSKLEADYSLNIGSITKRISELRAAGYAITTLRKLDITGRRYVRYTLDA